MKIKRLPNRAKMVQVPWMSIDGMRFEVPSDFCELVVDLCDCDGYGSAMTLYNRRIREVFLAAGLIDENSRLACFGTSKLREFKDMLLDAAHKVMSPAKFKKKAT